MSCLYIISNWVIICDVRLKIVYYVAVLQCEVPPAPPHAHSTHQESGILFVGDSIQYICEEGYEVVRGDLQRYCTHNLNWDGYPPECYGRLHVH